MRRLARLLALAAVLGACGGGSGDGAKTERDRAAEAQADRMRADRVVLAQADLPGFRPAPAGEDSGAPVHDALARCSDRPLAFLDSASPRLARGQEFAGNTAKIRAGSPPHARAGSFAVLVETAEEATGTVAAVRRVVAGECFSGALAEGLSQKLGGTDVVVREFDVPALTEEAVGRRVIFNRVVGGARVAAHLDYVVFRQGRALAGILVGGVDVPFYRDERVRISGLLTDRLVAEEGSGPRPPASPSTTSAGQAPRVPNTVGMTLPRARAALLEAGFISIKANDGAGRGRVPPFDDASWTVRAQFPGGPTQLPNLPDVVMILEVLKPGERYTPTTSPCPPLAQC